MNYLEKVDQYIAAKSEWEKSLSLLRDILATTELQETVKWGAPVYTVDGKNLVGLAAFKTYCGIWFFQGALLNDPQKVLVNAQEGKTKALRQWRFGPMDEIPADKIKSYVEETIANHKQGRIIKPSAPHKKPLEIPEELQLRLNNDSGLQDKFNSLSLTRKREFSEFVATAKRNETRVKRLEKVLNMIEEGKGLYDKYK